MRGSKTEHFEILNRKAIELDPRNALGYANSGDGYSNLGNNERAISDYKIGARIGHVGCQRVLGSMGISWQKFAYIFWLGTITALARLVVSGLIKKTEIF